MLSFDRDIFFLDLPLRTGLTPKASVKDGISLLLDDFEGDAGFTQIRDVAYVLATIRWETGQTFQPVREKRASREKNPRLWEIQNHYWSSGFFGRGYVQITWEGNYQNASDRLAGSSFTVSTGPLTVQRETLVKQPDLVLQPAIAYAIAARGMREGWFTGKKLSDFIQDGKPPDYINARKIINGLDQAQTVAGYAAAFELVLRAANSP